MKKEYLEVPSLEEMEITSPERILEDMLESSVKVEDNKSLLLDLISEKFSRKEKKKAQKERQRKEKEERQFRLLEKQETRRIEKAKKRCHRIGELMERRRLASRNSFGHDGNGNYIPQNQGTIVPLERLQIPPFCIACKRHHW